VAEKFVSEKPVSERPVIEKPIAQKKVCFDEFELDYGRFQLRRGSSAVKLEGLPLQLLMFLVENKGQLVTREQIAAALWGKDVFVDIEQGINTAIRKIRMALEDDVAQPQYLQTVVGRGYRFIAVTSPDADETTNSPGAGDGLAISPAELGRAIMAAAGLDPENPKGPPKLRGDS
jgi:DNA-binding winged helix-turn-helix (wHTH) protein